MTVRTPSHLVALLPVVSLSMGSVPFTIAGTIATCALAAGPRAARAQSQNAAGEHGNGIARMMRPTISVLGVGDLDDQGRSHMMSQGNGDALASSMAEEAITESHAFRLLSRDLMAEQVKEIKLDAEGQVDPATAQKFGKSAGIERFVTVFISGHSVNRLNDPDATPNEYPLNGDVVTAAVTGTPSGNENHSSNGLMSAFNRGFVRSKNIPGTSSGGPAVMRANTVIMCRFTIVETGERTTVSFSGQATADAQHGDEKKVERASLKNAFDNLSLYLSRNHPPLLGNVTEVADGKAIVDLGEKDGLTPGMGFEICAVKKIGSFTTYDHICDACVKEVNPNMALLDLGEYKKQRFGSRTSFHQEDDMAKQVHAGYIIRELAPN